MINIVITALIFHFLIAILITYIHWLNKNLNFYKSLTKDAIPLTGEIIKYEKKQFNILFLGRRINGERNDPLIRILLDNSTHVPTFSGSISQFFPVDTKINCYSNKNSPKISINSWEYMCLGIVNIFFSIFLHTKIFDYSLDLFEFISEYNQKIFQNFKKTAKILLFILLITTYVVLFNLFCSELKLNISTEQIYDKTEISENFSVITIDKNYDYIGSFNNGRACVTLNKLSGYIDESGQEVIPLVYPIARNFNNGVAEVFDNNRFKNPKYIDVDGNYLEKPLLKTQKDTEKNIQNNLPRFQASEPYENYALIDSNGKKLTENLYFSPGHFDNLYDLARIGKNNYKFYIWEPDKVILYGYLNTNGKIIIKPQYLYADYNFGNDNMACVAKSFYIDIPLSGNTFYKQNLYYGIIDTSGNTLIPFRYTKKISFHENVAITKGAKGYNGGKWEIIKLIK